MKAKGKISNASLEIKGLLIVIPLIICLFHQILPQLPASSSMRESFWAHKIAAKPIYDVVFVGDSRVYRGIDPEVIESVSNHKIRAFNYGFSSAGLDSFLLGRASRLLDPKGKRTLVIAISANSFLPESLENGHIKSLLKWGQQDIWIKKNLYFRLTCFDPYAFSDIYSISKGEKYLEQFHLLSGFSASNKIPLDSGSALQAYKEQFRRQQYSIAAEESFLHYLDLLKSRGIKVIALRMPISYEMKQLEDESTGYKLERLRKQMEASGIKWIEISDYGYISYDGSHLTAESANRFSSEIASIIGD
jgi:hypothetical protein